MFLCKWRARKQISLQRDNKLNNVPVSYQSWGGCSTPSQWFIAHEKKESLWLFVLWNGTQKGRRWPCLGVPLLFPVMMQLSQKCSTAFRVQLAKQGYPTKWRLARHGESVAQSKNTHSWKPNSSTTKCCHQMDGWPLLWYEADCSVMKLWFGCLHCLVWWCRSWPVKDWKFFLLPPVYLSVVRLYTTCNHYDLWARFCTHPVKCDFSFHQSQILCRLQNYFRWDYSINCSPLCVCLHVCKVPK